MLRTGLPYDFEKMNEIEENGAVVDMHDLQFPASNQIRTAFIFLRNTGYKNIKHDFSNCSEQEKAEYLRQYLTTDIEVSIPELLNGLKDVAYKLLHKKHQNIFFKDESFSEDKELMEAVMEAVLIVKASPLFLINKLRKDVNMDYPKTKTAFVGKNVPYLFTMTDIDEFYEECDSAALPLLFYEDIFTMENNELFSAINNSAAFYPFILWALEKGAIQYEHA